MAMSLSTSGIAQPFSARSQLRMRNEANVASVALNQMAITVTSRVRDKLTGRDFGNEEPLDRAAQVQRLIMQATSHENLSQLYIGWCPFW